MGIKGITIHPQSQLVSQAYSVESRRPALEQNDHGRDCRSNESDDDLDVGLIRG